MSSPELFADERALENHVQTLFEAHGYSVYMGDVDAKRKKRQACLPSVLMSHLQALNPGCPQTVLDEARRTLLKPPPLDFVRQNHQFHQWLIKGMILDGPGDRGEQAYTVRFVDWSDPTNNRFQVIRQFVVQGSRDYQADMVVFLNGLPLVVIELKKPGAEGESALLEAFKQVETYKDQVPQLFHSNVCNIISDGTRARLGATSARADRYTPWRARNRQGEGSWELDPLIDDFFPKERLLAFIRNYVIFSASDGGFVKMTAASHQVQACEDALAQVRDRFGQGDNKAGVVWHTQGSGKSLTMTCLAALLMKEKALKGPTIVVVTDRNDLDGQLYQTFTGAKDLLGTVPMQANGRDELREKLAALKTGGVYFTTIQKFGLKEGEREHPVLNERANVIVLSDEAHRSHNAMTPRMDKDGKVREGYALALRKALPKALFLGFTGTPLMEDDRQTEAVFGPMIDTVYDIQDAVRDGTTVPIYYEKRQIGLKLADNVTEVAAQAEDLLEDEEAEVAEAIKAKWTQLKNLVGAPKRLAALAEDLVTHLETRQSVIRGKAMVVCMSRELCVALFDALIAVRPDWAGERTATAEGGSGHWNHKDGAVRIVMTGAASDGPEIQPHLYTRSQKKDLEKRLKDPKDSLQVVIVRDMWLTGFDAPCVHTMYVDKPMKDHNLMQAVARVNRVFKDKDSGLIVDYIGIADALQDATKKYLKRSKSQLTTDVVGLRDAFEETLSRVRAMIAPHKDTDLGKQPMRTIGMMADAVLAHSGATPGANRRHFKKLAGHLKRSYSRGCMDAVIKQSANAVAVFDAVSRNLGGPSLHSLRLRETNAVMQDLVHSAVDTTGVTDLFTLMGMDSARVPLLSAEFLDALSNLQQQHIGVTLLGALMERHLQQAFRDNMVVQKDLSERLAKTLEDFHNGHIKTGQILEALYAQVRTMEAARAEMRRLGLDAQSYAFYRIITENPDQIAGMDEQDLCAMAIELVDTVADTVTVDWRDRGPILAGLRARVKRLLLKKNFPRNGAKDAAERIQAQATQFGRALTRDSEAEAERLKTPEPEPLPDPIPPPYPVVKDRARAAAMGGLLPMVPLKIAAGAFSEVQDAGFSAADHATDWMELPEKIADKGIFAAQVEGESMEPTIKDGDWCLFKAPPAAGSRNGRTVLAQHHSIEDPETGGSYTVKIYRSEKVVTSEDGFVHTAIWLEPRNKSGAYKAIEIDADTAAELRIVADYLRVLHREPTEAERIEAKIAIARSNLRGEEFDSYLEASLSMRAAYEIAFNLMSTSVAAGLLELGKIMERAFRIYVDRANRQGHITEDVRDMSFVDMIRTWVRLESRSRMEQDACHKLRKMRNRLAHSLPETRGDWKVLHKKSRRYAEDYMYITNLLTELDP